MVWWAELKALKSAAPEEIRQKARCRMNVWSGVCRTILVLVVCFRSLALGLVDLLEVQLAVERLLSCRRFLPFFVFALNPFLWDFFVKCCVMFSLAVDQWVVLSILNRSNYSNGIRERYSLRGHIFDFLFAAEGNDQISSSSFDFQYFACGSTN